MSLEHLDDEQPTIDALFASEDPAEFALALERILNEWKYMLRTIIVRAGCREDDIDDCLQELCLRLLRKKGNFDASKPLMPWVATVCWNVARDYLNVHKKGYAMESIDDEEDGNWELPSREPAPDSRMSDDEGYNELLSMILQLDDENGRAFMQYAEGKKYKEIAKQLGVSLGAIKSRIRAARTEIQENMRRRDVA